MQKQCSQCATVKPVEEFYVQRVKGKEVRRHAECKACFRSRQRAAYLRDPERKKEADRLYRERNGWRLRERNLQRYGVSAAEYDGMYDQQQGRCVVCRKPGTRAGTPGSNRREALCVDHCHDTGTVRGLLCLTCNRGIGMLGDNAETLRLAALYIETQGSLTNG